MLCTLICEVRVACVHLSKLIEQYTEELCISLHVNYTSNTHTRMHAHVPVLGEKRRLKGNGYTKFVAVVSLPQNAQSRSFPNSFFTHISWLHLAFTFIPSLITSKSSSPTHQNHHAKSVGCKCASSPGTDWNGHPRLIPGLCASGSGCGWKRQEQGDNASSLPSPRAPTHWGTVGESKGWSHPNDEEAGAFIHQLPSVPGWRLFIGVLILQNLCSTMCTGKVGSGRQRKPSSKEMHKLAAGIQIHTDRNGKAWRVKGMAL